MEMLTFLSLISFIYPCAAVIFNLNESEYNRMPALFGLDDYEACFSQQRGPYCLARLTLFDDKPNQIIDLIRDYSEFHLKHYNHSLLDRGVCVQHTCKSYTEATEIGEDEARALAACLNESIWQEYGVQANVSVLHCDSGRDQTDNVNALDWIVLAVFISIVAVNVAATCYDVFMSCNYVGNYGGNEYFLSFSIIKNYQWLTDTNRKTEDFQFIHFVRVLLNFFMILAHVMLIIGSGPTLNPHDFEKSYEHLFYRIMFNGMIVVQVFFMLSGLLLAHNVLIYAEKMNIRWFHVPKVMFLRYCRLSPSLCVVLAFCATWLRHAGSGPLWGLRATRSVVADCRKYWWTHLLYINNYVPGDKFCLLQTWHVAADYQLHVVGLVACLCVGVRWRRRALAGLLAAGTLLPALHVCWQDLDGLVLMYPEFYRSLDNPTYHGAHILGHCNLQCFVIGMALAFIVYDWRKKGIDFTRNKYWSVYLWLSPALAVASFCAGQVFYAEAPRAPLWARALFACSHRLLLAAICAPAFFALMLKAPSSIRLLGEWRGWTIPSRVSYSVYLVHMPLVHIVLATQHQLTTVSTYNLLCYQLGVVLASYIVAVPLFLMVEAPVNRLVKNLRGPGDLTQTDKEKSKVL